MGATLVKVTFPSAQAARTIGRALVEARLAASVNIAEGIASFYWWEGAVQEAALDPTVEQRECLESR